jgi:putative DNA primase/helicase
MDDGVNDPDNVNDYLDSIPRDAAPAGKVVSFPSGRSALDDGDLPVIRIVAGELHNMATAAEDALIKAGTQFYVRGEKLVRPVTEDLPASNGRRTKVARLTPVSAATAVDHLSRSAMWVKWDGRKRDWARKDPSGEAAGIMLSRDGEWGFRKLAGVITTPTLRPDGTILSTPGYDESTQLLLIEPPAMPAIPDKPTRDDAMKAIKLLDTLLMDFPFVDAASRSVALSAIITPVIRGAIAVTPMHVTTAPVPGSGKSYIIDIASAVNSGERAPVLTAGRNEEETEKRLVSALLSGQTIISIDNVNGDLGGDFLCQLIERPVVGVRPLGQSNLFKVESRASCYATGNNIHLVGDMTRRALLCSLDPGVERPELRSFHGSPFDQVLANRGQYVAAALTIARAYIVAGRPNLLPPLASFEQWSAIVRSAITWLGYTDPCESMARARADDPVTSALSGLLTMWFDAVQDVPHSTSAIRNQASLSGPHGDLVYGGLKDALLEVADDGRGAVNSLKLAKYLKRYEGRIISGLKIASGEDSHAKQKVWRVVRV